MKRVRHRYAEIKTAVAAVATGAVLCSVTAQPQAPAGSQQQVPQQVQSTTTGTIPFDPPVVHPGYGSHLNAFSPNRFRDNTRGSISRDLMFHNEDRKTFKALHPFLLNEPRSLSVQDRPPAASPSTPKSVR